MDIRSSVVTLTGTSISFPSCTFLPIENVTFELKPVFPGVSLNLAIPRNSTTGAIGNYLTEQFDPERQADLQLQD